MAQKLDKELEKKLEDFNKGIAASAENVIFAVFPAKIIELSNLIDETSSASSLFHSEYAKDATDVRVYPSPNNGDGEPDTKKRRMDVDGSLPGSNDTMYARYLAQVRSNQHLTKVHDVVKRQCEELAKSCDTVKLWINLSMPRIEDGDNFGVQVQEECLNELHRSQESSMNLRDAARQHHLTRAKIASKLIKYPHIDDYTIGLREHDEKTLYVARQNLSDLRNIYAVLFDILNKNIQKLRTPKGNNSSNMY